MKLCECGCGLPVTSSDPNARFVNYHYSKTEEGRQQISVLFKGKKKTKEHSQNIGNANKGKKRTEEWKQEQSQRITLLWQNPEFRTHQIKIRKEMAKDPQWRAMHSAITKRAWANPETRVKFLARAPSEFTADHRRKISKALTGRKFSEEHKRKISEAAQKRMQDPKERQRMQDMRAVAMNKRPTGPEVVYDEITPPIIRYVGNGQWWRNMPNGSKKNPDFKVTGQDKVIEIWGDYWHRNDSPKEEIDHYSEAGLRCLVFWEHEIYQQPDMVLIKTIDFLSA